MIVGVIHFLITISFLRSAKTTIDMNVAELQYIANHLHSEECRKLCAYIHFKSFEPPLDANQAENNVPRNIPCLQLLLHWNSEVGEGKGQTHEILYNRLNQIGRQDLAEWLGKMVYHQLGLDLKNNLQLILEDSEVERTTDHQCSNNIINIDVTNSSTWVTFDKVCYIIVCILVFLIVIVVFFIICQLTVGKNSKKFTKTNKVYHRLHQNYSSSDGESEDITDNV